jgi:hypothetical protein
LEESLGGVNGKGGIALQNTVHIIPTAVSGGVFGVVLAIPGLLPWFLSLEKEMCEGEGAFVSITRVSFV